MTTPLKASAPWLTARNVMHSALRRRNLVAVNIENTVPARRTKILRQLAVATFLDIGANNGQYAQELRAYGYTGRLISFEPCQTPWEVLQSVSADDAAWDTRKVAVGAEPGELVMNIAANSSHSSALQVQDGYVAVTKAAHVIGQETVGVDSLDNLAGDVAGTFGVKIDVQGFETHVLDGGAAALGRAAFLEMELNLIDSYAGEVLAPGLLERVFGMGFRLALTENIGHDKLGGAIAVNGLFVRA